MRLALIGKELSHSRSQFVYESILGVSINYELLDIPAEAQLPELSQTFKQYMGVSITAPYKSSYLNDVTFADGVGPELRQLGVNCLSREEGEILATNTDFLATSYVVKSLLKKRKFSKAIIFGSGVMAKVTALVFDKMKLTYNVVARKSHGPIEKLDLKDSETNLFLNCCSRDFIFSGKLPPNSVFLDQNYQVPLQGNIILKEKDQVYIDGGIFLILQAYYSLLHWKIIR